MLPMIELGALLLFGVAILVVVAVAAAVLKVVLWAVFLPFRLLFWLLGGLVILPFLLLKLLFGAVMFVLTLPLLLLGLIAGAIAAAVGLMLPLLPLILLAALIYYLVRPEPHATHTTPNS